MSFVKDIFDKAMREAPDTGAKFVQPSKLSSLIYESENTIKAINPDLWPKLKKEADYYASIAPQFERIDVSNGMDIFNAWGVLSPKSKKLVENIGKGIAIGTRAGTKAGLRIGGRDIFDTEGGTP